MVIDINLLEEKEQSNRLPVLIIGAGVILLCLVLAVFYWQKRDLTQEQQLLNEEIQSIQAEQAEFQQTAVDAEQEQRQQLAEAVDRMENRVFPTVALVEKMIALLPERGYFQSYSFEDSGVMDIQVRFDSLQEVAAYTNTLSERNYIGTVEVGNILTEEVDESLNQFEYRPRYIANYTVMVQKQAFREEVAPDAD
ncbi:hypothetical protein LCM20_04965 [Halobacillus litoralis]|uniref:PilN domain-containing protein n=1 Tax=Halobacillus litoralis TaxID=45668 RepID=UPI001CD3DA14|nr:hypothetical protein [Halobacillus litoralis]MCA0969930.1 hypothetical protein [Halobacillus litoralis]